MMNAFVKKEIRLLLPTFIAALLLACFFGLALTIFAENGEKNLSLGTSIFYRLLFVLAPGAMILLALDSFGREVSAGTFSNLLAQPISRVKIWRTKTVLLGAAIFLVYAVGLLPCFNSPLFANAESRHVTLVATILFALVVFSGGLWTVLLLRQVAAAFWFTLIVPGTLTMPVLFLSQKHPDITEPALIIVLSIYSVAGFFFARWLFLRAQDVHWTGGEITLPGFFSSLKLKTASEAGRNWHPRAALFAKEFQLHQSQLVMAGALFLLHLGVIVARKFGDFKDSPGTEFVLGAFWVLWFAMPLIIGCAAVAEERKLGTLESQLCLPARRRTQFWIKFLFAMALSLILAVGIPLLLEGSRILPDFHPKFLAALSEIFSKREGVFSAAIGNAFAFVNFSMPILILLGLAALIATISFYASTLSRNTLQSLAPAVVGIGVAFTLLMGARDVGKVLPFLPWRGALIHLIGVPILTVTLVWLMFWNFKRVLVNGKVWGWNTIVVIASLAFVIGTTSAVYHRVWEFLAPIEPAHGPARLKSSDLVKLETLGNAITVQFHDGRVWSGSFAPSENLATMFSGAWKLKPLFGAAKFLEETNWKSVSISQAGMFGIQNDGSLWASEKRITFKSKEPKLVRFGLEKDWKAVSGWYPFPFLLKQNGTLWRLNAESWNQKNEPWPGIQNFPIKQLGTNSDWAEIFPIDWRTAFRKANGETWAIGISTSADTPQLRFDDKRIVYRAEFLDGLKSGTWAWNDKMGSFFAGVRNEGELVITVDFNSRDREPLGIQLGNESDWRAVAGAADTIVSLKPDGSLWKWKFNNDPIHHPKSTSATRLGQHSDWIEVCGLFGGVIGLAADGSLWFWQFEPFSSNEIRPLLSASRKPQKIANIFETPKTP